uniref:Signal recognition particle subunit SRP72 n=1 Tax=Nomascus leucogenys TaxID=61853 RepID=A0A2I3GJF0_NOMLE
AKAGGSPEGGVSVPALWNEVNRYGQNSNFMCALKTVNKILQINKDDVTGLHCKVICLIQNGSFREALNVINTCTKLLANNSLSFEKAYYKYRLNRIENALKTIESANQQTDKLKELYGQVLYRLERYDECLAVYGDLVRNSQDDYDEERKTNLSAVLAAQSNWEKVVPENLGLQEGTHELCYNTACALIGQGQLNQAMKILQKAEDLCRRSLSEDTDGTEKDPQDQNVFDSKKVEFKLSKKQLQAIEFNKALLAMYTNQAEQCLKISASLHSQSPKYLLPMLIQAAQLCHAKATELLQEFSDQHKENAVEIKLTMAQSSHKLSGVTLEQLRKQNPKDIHTLAQLISAYSLVDTEKGKALSKHLPSSDSMSLKVDVEALENSPGAMYIWKGGKVTRDSQPKEQGKGDLKKKKKGKLWLPMQECSFYQGRKGKKKDQIGKGTQGATAGTSSELDARKTVSSPSTSPRSGSAATLSASTSNIIPPRQQRPAGAQATKKKQQQKKKKGGKGGW